MVSMDMPLIAGIFMILGLLIGVMMSASHFRDELKEERKMRIQAERLTEIWRSEADTLRRVIRERHVGQK